MNHIENNGDKNRCVMRNPIADGSYQGKVVGVYRRTEKRKHGAVVVHLPGASRYVVCKRSDFLKKPRVGDAITATVFGGCQFIIQQFGRKAA